MDVITIDAYQGVSMNVFTRRLRALSLTAALAVGSVFVSGAFAQDAQADTAYVPFIVNVDATVKAELDVVGAAAAAASVQVSVKAGTEALIRIPLQKTIGVLNGARGRANRLAVIVNRGGKVTLNLPAQSYESAEIALYSLNGKRILRRKASSASGVSDKISRPNLTTGVYLLSVRGNGGDAVTSRLAHRGGSLDIDVVFGGESRLSAERLAKRASSDGWIITVSADGYYDSLNVFSPKAGVNAQQNVTLREAPFGKYAVIVSSAGAGATESGDYAVGTTVVITAGTAPAGQQFKNWVSADSNVIFANAYNPTTKFVMPASAVSVAAVFEPQSVTPPATYAVTVLSAGAGATGGGDYTGGAIVNITAGTAADKQFKNWTTTSNSVIFADANSAATRFVMPTEAVTVTAVFEAAPSTSEIEMVYVAGNKTIGDFYIGKYEVTQGQWKAVTGALPEFVVSSTYGFGDNYPIYYVSLNETYVFIDSLNSKTGKKYRLPTSAEWEYAARGGSISGGYSYAGSNTIWDVAWFRDNSGGKTHPVGGKSPNELGIYDMTGNVSEWVSDVIGDDYVDKDNGMGGTERFYANNRLVRGSSWSHSLEGCSWSYSSSSYKADDRNQFFGIRLVLSP
jgi:formylglycine-generating enzyme required for sulfatase activity